ncbi:hypothetical protein Tco_0716130 [Tanacetum coccineum]
MAGVYDVPLQGAYNPPGYDQQYLINLKLLKHINDLESDDESIDAPLVSPFLDSDDELDDGEVLDELDEYGNAGIAYNTIMVEGLESTERNLVAIIRDVYVFVRSFTYVMDFVVLEDIGELIVSDMSKVMMGRPFRAVTQLEYDCVKG